MREKISASRMLALFVGKIADMRKQRKRRLMQKIDRAEGRVNMWHFRAARRRYRF